MGQSRFLLRTIQYLTATVLGCFSGKGDRGSCLCWDWSSQLECQLVAVRVNSKSFFLYEGPWLRTRYRQNVIRRNASRSSAVPRLSRHACGALTRRDRLCLLQITKRKGGVAPSGAETGLTPNQPDA
jgi:hypothetical protein